MKKTVLQLWRGVWPKVKSSATLPIGEGVVDQVAFDTIELDEVFDTLNLTQSVSGQTVLYRSLTQPLKDLAEIQAKQQAVQEIAENKALRKQLEAIVSQSAAKESRLFLLLFGEFLGSMGTAHKDQQIEGYGYKQYRRGVHFMLNLVDQMNALQPVESAHLNDVLDSIKAFSESRTYSLMKGPVYNSERGIQTKQERKGSFIPATIFKPTLFKPLLIIALIVAVKVLITLFPFLIAFFTPATSIFLLPVLLVYFPVVGTYDRDNCIIPLRDEFKQCEALGKALDSLGQLDELLAFIKYAENFAGATSLPELIASDSHKLDLIGAKNSVLAYKNPQYVGNDFSFAEKKLIFVTGPNSGGKTALCKTITQIQILAQIGCYVPAEKATMTVADCVFYQAPEISHLDDGEGRFGTELKRTKAIFLAVTAESLVVLDELSEGTTFEEKLESSTNVLEGFYRKGNNTILITHNHQLVDVFMKKKLGVAKQVEFINEAPSYKLVDGISRVSHADRVAKKIGFSKQDIEQMLTGKK